MVLIPTVPVPLSPCASGEQEVVGCQAYLMDLDRVIVAQGDLGVIIHNGYPAFCLELLKTQKAIAGDVQDIAASRLEAENVIVAAVGREHEVVGAIIDRINAIACDGVVTGAAGQGVGTVRSRKCVFAGAAGKGIVSSSARKDETEIDISRAAGVEAAPRSLLK